MPVIAEVLLPVPLSKTFDYYLTDKAVVGQRVWVEFGKEKYQIGLIVGLRAADVDEIDKTQLKTILSVLDDFPIVDAQWWELLRFASRYYAEPLGKALRNALPARLRIKDQLTLPRVSYFSLSEQGKQCCLAGSLAKKAKRQQRFLKYCFEKNQPFTEAQLRQQDFQKSDWDKAVENGFLLKQLRSPYQEDKPIQAAAYTLNDEQQQIIDTIVPQLQQHQAHLIYGVTGSGKTEVYIRLIEEVLAQDDGYQAQILLLVPEISLTPQMLARFTQRFGRRVAAYHSGMTDVARRDVFLAAQTGELPILIGTRSAIFVPLPQLQLILVDEEHDVSYKQHEGFLYHARDLAMFRAKQMGINVILGSATPSLESLYNVTVKKLQQHHLSQRATRSLLPRIEMVDRRGHGRENVLADRVIQAMRQVLQTGKQVLLFLNRRGFSPVMQCGRCGWSSDCPSCSVYQTVHLSNRQLCCHHCGHIEPLPIRCPSCQDTDIYFVGMGTEKLESQLHQQFPKHRILRLDRDKQTTAKQLDSALEKVHNGEVDIILGTQLVVKGHHFPNVDMVCVVDADSALFSSDFRAEERLYQQLIQVAGRAGRESDVGCVYIQSSLPEHDVFHALLRHDYAHYAQQLLIERREYGLPPYQATALVKASALDKPLLVDYLRAVSQALTEHNEAIEVLGPVPLAVEKVNNRFRAQLWLSTNDKVSLQNALPLLGQIIQHFDKSNRFQTIIDVDAMGS